jgi:hypothetical protein
MAGSWPESSTRRFRKKQPPLEHAAAHVLPQVLLDEALHPPERVPHLAKSPERDLLPDIHRPVVGRGPDLLLAAEMPVQPAFREARGGEEVVDRRVVVALDRKELKRFLGDVLAGVPALG